MKNKQFLSICIFAILSLLTVSAYSQYQIRIVGSGATSLSYCYGTSGTFELELYGASCPGTYSWSYNSGSGWNTITGTTCNGVPRTGNLSYPTVSTTYKCLVNGQAEYPFYVTVYDTPVHTVSGGGCCGYGGTVTLSGSTSGVNYRLYKDGVYTGENKPGTGSSLTFSPNTNGTYTIWAFYQSGACSRLMNGYARFDRLCCKNSDLVSNEEEQDRNVRIFPNPNQGNFTIETNGIGEYVVVNELGQEVFQINMTQENTVNEIKGLKPGVYFLKNINGNTTNVSKIIVVE
jgi:hypothetical protein